MLTLRLNSIPSPRELVGRAKTFWWLVVEHAKVHWVAYVALWAVWMLASSNYVIGFNQTPSLPQSVFVIHKNEPVNKGDYVAFHVPPAAAWNFKNPNATLTKIAVGMEGDVVSVDERVVKVNGVPVGYAKERSLKGQPLSPIDPVTVPAGHVYVMGLHKDSLDSRYTIVGLVPFQSIVGKAYPLF